DQAIMNRYATAQARLEHAGGYGWRDHATAVLRGLGFAEVHLERPLRTFSGGELTRASLARALGGDPDLLLLDEPTHHLAVDRFRAKKDKAKQAQAKLTHIGRLEKQRQEVSSEISLLSRKQRSLGFEFLKPARSGRVVIEASGLSVRIGDRELLRDATFALDRGEHVALVGPNGSGKTTLLETILGRRDAAAGRVKLGHGVEAAYFSQQELELDTRGSVLQCVQTMTGLSRP